MLSHSQLNQIMQALQTREALLLANLRRAIRERAGRDNSDLEASGGDDSEQSIADLLEELDTSQMNQEAMEFKEIQSAYEALRDQTYGRCADCGNPIGFRRLLVLPMAQRCLACQETVERANVKVHEHTL